MRPSRCALSIATLAANIGRRLRVVSGGGTNGASWTIRCVDQRQPISAGLRNERPGC